MDGGDSMQFMHREERETAGGGEEMPFFVTLTAWTNPGQGWTENVSRKELEQIWSADRRQYNTAWILWKGSQFF